MSIKKKSSAIKSNAAPVKMESDGDWLQSNIWFKIGLTKAEAPMLKTIARGLFKKPATSACVARKLLLTALAHYDKLERMMYEDEAYSKAEDFLMTDMYLHGLVARQHAKIAEREQKMSS